MGCNSLIVFHGREEVALFLATVGAVKWERTWGSPHQPSSGNRLLLKRR